MAKRRFRDLSPRSRAFFVLLGVVQVSLNAAAQIDITRRDPSEVRGPKLGWRLVSMINIIGPLTYFLRGRLPHVATATPAEVQPPPRRRFRRG